MRLLCYALLLTLAACRAPQPHVQPFPALPDSVFSAAGPIPVVLVDDIKIADSTMFVLGRYDFMTRTIYIRRGVTDPIQRQRILSHELCHIRMLDSGLHNHTAPWYLEMLCDLWADTRVGELQRGKP